MRKSELHKTIRLGQINFINCFPINIPLLSMKNEAVEVYSSYPSEINRMLYTHEIHLGPVSLAEYLLHQQHYKLMENISISSIGKTESIILFSNTEFTKLHNKTILLPYTSATSVNLLKILFKKHNVQPAQYITHYYKTSLEKHLLQADAVLYIGDPALQYNYKDIPFYKYDLGEMWHQLTNLPMVYGVWAISKNWFETSKDDFIYISNLIHSSLRTGLGGMFQDVVTQACHATALGRSCVEQYFIKSMNYKLTDLHKESIDLFHRELSHLTATKDAFTLN